MNSNQRMVIEVDNTGKNWLYWVEDQRGVPPQQGLNVNSYTVKATLGTAIQAELPTLGT